MIILAIICLIAATALFLGAPKTLLLPCRATAAALLLAAVLLNYFSSYRIQAADATEVELGQAVQDAGFLVPMARLSAKLGGHGKIVILGPADAARLSQCQARFPSHEFVWTGDSGNSLTFKLKEATLNQAVKAGAAAIVCFGVAPDQAEELFFQDDEARCHLPILILGGSRGLAPLITRGGIYAAAIPKEGLIQDGKDHSPEVLFAAHYEWLEAGKAIAMPIPPPEPPASAGPRNEE